MDATNVGLSVRMRGVVGIADSDWLRLTPGVSVLTGRNNVGKSRALTTIGNLVQIAAGGAIPVPEVRLEGDDLSLEIGFDAGGLPDRYEVNQVGKSSLVNWHEIQGGWQVQVDQGPLHGFSPSRPSLSALGDVVPQHLLVRQVLERLLYLPPQRTVTAIVSTVPTQVPSPSGQDLANVIYTHLNQGTRQFDEFRSVAMELFPEIGGILTIPSGTNEVTLTFSDRFSGRGISLQESGTGVGQALHLIGMVLFSPPGRIFLIDEPHVFLHPGAERLLVRFLSDHPEHSYVCATHSPVFINAAEPERCWLVTRDEGGTHLQSVFEEGLARQHILTELGIEPGEVALAERIIFVEGDSDELVYPILLRRLEWDPVMTNCAVINMSGAGTTRPVAQVLGRLGEVLHTTFTVCLDGDQRGQDNEDAHVRYLPLPELENLFLGDASAIRKALLSTLEEEGGKENVPTEWPASTVEEYIVDYVAKHPGAKGSKVLTDLAWEMGTTYRKRVHDPLIAEALRIDLIEPVRETLAGFFPPIVTFGVKTHGS